MFEWNEPVELSEKIDFVKLYIAHVEREVAKATDDRTRAIRLFVLCLAEAELKKLRSNDSSARAEEDRPDF